MNKNIANLKMLWTLAAEPFGGIEKAGVYNIVNLEFSEWPNRVWIDKPNVLDISLLHDIMYRGGTKLTFTNWHRLDFDEFSEELLVRIPLKSVLVGMSLSLKDFKHKVISEKPKITLRKILEKTDTTEWSRIFKESFNYDIPSSIVDEIKDKVNFYLIRNGMQNVGCVMTLEHDNDMGVYSLGVLPEFRKLGIAEMTMQNLLRTAKEKNIENIHLQASQMGLYLYRKLGFTEKFKMCNYKQ